jgi:hypothetical protein
MRLALCLAASLAFGGCSDSNPGREPGGPLQTDKKAANGVLARDPGRAGDLPRQDAGPRFVGQWAASEGSCASDPWLFTATSLHMPGGLTCSFNRVVQIADGYEIQATCSADAGPTSDELEISFDEAAKRMRIQSETIAGDTLVFCGRIG